ncbi:MAG: Holliday junction branch migration protein RuvA [Patescibacteria group bacterium]|nr:Holliday junction branch migration protein RuvA [Patescibacteria group bacterium]
MIHTLEGVLELKSSRSAVINVGGVGFSVYFHDRTLRGLPRIGSKVKVFTHLNVKEDALELYGFLDAGDLAIFNLLHSVSGVGPKSALSVLDVAEHKEIEAAIKENRPDLLSRASGIGRKTAERIILELKNKIVMRGTGAMVEHMESDADLAEALVGMGYSRDEARIAITKTEAHNDLGVRFREALKILGRKKTL